MRTRVRLSDLAYELDVSPSTISRALSGDPRISHKTRSAASELAKRWGYIPNAFAVNLLKKKSNNIGLILPEFTNPYFSNVLLGIDKVINENDLHLLINTHNGDYEKEIKASRVLNSLMIDGLLVAYARNTSDFQHYENIIYSGVPIVFFDRLCEDIEASYVITDDFQGAQDAMNHFIQSGCKKIAHLKGPENLSTSFTRMMGYLEGLKRNGLGVNEDLILSWNENPVTYKKQIIDFLNQHKVDAIFAYDDYMAYEVAQILLETGTSIPDEVSIIGFSDDPISQYAHPRISTVAQNAELMGKRATEILLNKLENPDSKEIFTEMLPTKLILRQTTKNVF